MHNHFSLSIILFCASIAPIFAQNNLVSDPDLTEPNPVQLPCSAHSYEQSLDPVDRLKRQIAIYGTFGKQLTTYKNDSTVYVIPVVVHVIHDNGAENVSFAQIQSAIDQLNKDFNKLSPDSAQVVATFKPVHASAKIKFRLAQKDPNGNCTNGVVRVQSTLTANANDNVKGLSYWPRENYFNIWVARRVVTTDGNVVGGYAYRPGFIPSANVDGIILVHSQFGNTGTSTGNFAARTVSHEAGHWLGLEHTWGGTNTPGLASNCNIDDGIMDTPNTVGNSGGCNLTRVSCGSLDNVENIMDYAGCAKMFTQGQGDLMRFIIENNVDRRGDLVSKSNQIATGVYDTIPTVVCPPVISKLNVSRFHACPLNRIDLNAEILNADPASLTYQWIVPGASITFSNNNFVSVSYPNPGIYTVKLKITGPGGSDEDSVVRAITIQNPRLFNYFEGFEDPNWPLNANAKYIALDPNQSSTHQFKISSASFEGSKSLGAKCSGLSNGTIREFVLPINDIQSDPNNLIVRFSYVYAKNSSTSNDTLLILESINCGSSFRTSPVLTLPLGQNAVPGTFNGFDFFPTSKALWKTTQATFPLKWSNRNDHQIKFQLKTGGNGGNYFYIDSIFVGYQGTTTSLAEELQNNTLELFPNPNDGNFFLKVGSNINKNPFTIQVFDASGKQVHFADYPGFSELLELNLPNSTPKGLYILHLNNGQETKQLKFSVE